MRSLCLVTAAAAAAAAGGNASEAEPTKVEVAKRIENWFGAGEHHGGVARRGNGVACQRTKWGTIRFAGGRWGQAWQRQVMVYSYSQSGSGVRSAETTCAKRSNSAIDPDLSSRVY